MVMLPVMLYARKLDAEDPQIVLLLRCTYAFSLLLSVCASLYIRYKVSSPDFKKGLREKVYSPKPAGMFDDPTAPKKYLQKDERVLYAEKAQEMFTQTLMSACMTCGLHYYKGMVMGLAMQTVMGPFGLYENALVKKFILGDSSAMGVKGEAELTDQEVVVEVDAAGKETVIKGPGATAMSIKDRPKKATKGGKKVTKEELEEMILDTWDQAAEADLSALATVLTEANVNTSTAESGWTPLMVMSGTDAPGCTEALASLKLLGADVTIKDGEGWTALHWSAYHGNARAAKALCEGFDAIEKGLHEVKDKEGKDVKDLCDEEGNNDVWEAICLHLKGGDDNEAEGIRRRNNKAE